MKVFVATMMVVPVVVGLQLVVERTGVEVQQKKPFFDFDGAMPGHLADAVRDKVKSASNAVQDQMVVDQLNTEERKRYDGLKKHVVDTSDAAWIANKEALAAKKDLAVFEAPLVGQHAKKAAQAGLHHAYDMATHPRESVEKLDAAAHKAYDKAGQAAKGWFQSLKETMSSTPHTEPAARVPYKPLDAVSKRSGRARLTGMEQQQANLKLENDYPQAKLENTRLAPSAEPEAPIAETVAAPETEASVPSTPSDAASTPQDAASTQ